MIEFHYNGLTYVYDFALLGIHRITRAITVYRWHQQQQQEASRKSIRDLKLSGGFDYQPEAFNHLLIRKVGDDYAEFDSASDAPKDFFKSLPSEYWEKVQQVEQDFFSHTGLRDVGLTKQSLDLLQSIHPQLLEQLVHTEIGKRNRSSNTNNESPDFSTPENSDGD